MLLHDWNPSGGGYLEEAKKPQIAKETKNKPNYGRKKKGSVTGRFRPKDRAKTVTKSSGCSQKTVAIMVEFLLRGKSTDLTKLTKKRTRWQEVVHFLRPTVQSANCSIILTLARVQIFVRRIKKMGKLWQEVAILPDSEAKNVKMEIAKRDNLWRRINKKRTHFDRR